MVEVMGVKKNYFFFVYVILGMEFDFLANIIHYQFILL